MVPTLRLPAGIKACLFDLDGVLTQTAKVHAAAWKAMFDQFLRQRAEATGAPFREFDIDSDYARYVDGKPREDGVKSFLESRGIDLPQGKPGDPPEAETVVGLGARKDQRFQQVLQDQGVEVYDGSVRFVEAVRDAGLRRAVVSSSRNTREVLNITGIADLFEVRIDGVVAAEEGLPGKPAPDTFLAAAAKLSMDPKMCAVFEDAVSGVQAGRAGAFGYVIGVDRFGRPEVLREHGADIVVSDLSELLVDA